MMTDCNQKVFAFHALGHRDVVARFDGGTITSDGGGLLLREAERLTGVIRQFAACFTDHRDPDLIEHAVEDLIAQRVYGLALGYEDLNDHDELRHDPMLAVLVGKDDPTGNTRLRDRDRGQALAGKSTLNRLELTPVRADKNSRYKKITRGDSGFCREHIMHWCEEHDVDYVLGLAKNDRLKREIEAELEQAEALFKQTGEPARVFKGFTYQTRRSWSRPRRVVGKAEHLAQGANPRFVVTSRSVEDYPARTLYEVEYCARGDMENRISLTESCPYQSLFTRVYDHLRRQQPVLLRC